MNKVIVGLISVVVILGAIITGVLVFSPNDKVASEAEEITIASEKVTDDCIDEFDEFEEETILETNSDKEKISPNCMMTLRREYTGCNHTINEYVEIPAKLVNKTEEELMQEYGGWNLEKFSSNEVILSVKLEGECGKHYVLRPEDGKIVVYKINEDGKEEKYKDTEIFTEYITQTDKINLEKGIKVYGEEALNQMIEDFE